MNAPLSSHVLPAVTSRPLPEAMRQALQARFGERFSTAAAVREQHGRDESPFPVTPPKPWSFAKAPKRWPPWFGGLTSTRCP